MLVQCLVFFQLNELLGFSCGIGGKKPIHRNVVNRSTPNELVLPPTSCWTRFTFAPKILWYSEFMVNSVTARVLDPVAAKSSPTHQPSTAVLDRGYEMPFSFPKQGGGDQSQTTPLLLYLSIGHCSRSLELFLNVL